MSPNPQDAARVFLSAEHPEDLASIPSPLEAQALQQMGQRVADAMNAGEDLEAAPLTPEQESEVLAARTVGDRPEGAEAAQPDAPQLVSAGPAEPQLLERAENARLVYHLARICHQVNRAYCRAIGDNSQPEWAQAPEWQVQSAVAGVRKHLEAMAQGLELAPEESHQLWMQHKAAEGWRYCTVKDEAARTHPAMLPYKLLPVHIQAKDAIFSAIVREITRPT